MANKKRHTLITEDPISPIRYCVGMISPLKSYQVAWHINQRRCTSLYRQEYITFHNPNERDMRLFAHYLYEEGANIYRLLYNKLELRDHCVQPFIKEWSIFDYLLLLNVSEQEKQSWIKELHHIPGVQYVHELDPQSLSEPSWIIF